MLEMLSRRASVQLALKFERLVLQIGVRLAELMVTHIYHRTR